MVPDYAKSIEFLKRFHPARNWVLTAISLDKRNISTQTFDDDSIPACLSWLETHGAARNIYFSVGEVPRKVDKKAERTDISNVWWLHVDVDPRAGEDVAAEQSRILTLLQSSKGLPPPTVIVYSGGGYQAFWKLDNPIAIDCDLAKAEDAKRYNLQIEIILGADNVHNIDRIMRLPGTVNRPDEKKIKKGRTAVTSTVVEWHGERLYPISAFQKAPEVQVVGSAASFGTPTPSKQKAVVSGNIRRLNSVDELPSGVHNRVKVVICQGFDPDEPNKFQGRSEWLFYACCGMMRGGCDDDMVYSVITDPQFRISDSVLDKGSMTEKYALRQIERAKEDAIDPKLRELNERHAIISNWSGKCRVVEEQFDEVMQRFRLTKQTFDDFRNRYMHVKVVIGANDKGVEIKRPLGDWWLQHENRRQFDKLIFAPGKDVPGAYNLWRGFACEARPGDCSLFLNHLRENICLGNETHYDYLIKWMARTVQFPDSPGYSAVVFRGGQGTGKSFVAKTLGSLFGRHYMQVTDPKHLVGSFNSHLRDCVVLLGDEAFYAGDKKHESVLKMLITEEMITTEAKGVDAEVSGNCIHLMMASNESWVVPAGLDDRRFFVLDVGSNNKNDTKYFEAIVDQLSKGGREALLHYLMTLDLSSFNVRTVPKTAALQAQKLFSMGTAEGWWFDKLRDGRLMSHDGEWKPEIAVQVIHEDFLIYCRQFGINRRGTAYSLRATLQTFVPQGILDKYQGTGSIQLVEGGVLKTVERPYYYMFPDLTAAREHWDKHFGGPYEWTNMKIKKTGDEKPSPF